MNLICSRESSDLGDVIRSAEALSISEYDFFRLAFRPLVGP